MKRWLVAVGLVLGLCGGAQAQPVSGGLLGRCGGSGVPSPSLADAGKVPAVNAGGTAYELISAAGTGTVTSVGITAPSIFSVADSPVTASGTIALALATQAANRVWAGPATGADAAPTFRALVAADLGSFTLSLNLDSATMQPATDRQTLTLRRNGAAQTSKIQEWQSEVNATLASVDKDGNADFTGLTLDNPLPVAEGGTGLSALGSALQVLRVNAGGTAYEFADAASGSGTPGGTSGQLQYNDGGAFAGVPGSEITNYTHTLMRIDPTETYAGIMRVSQVGSGATARLEAAAGDEVALVEVSAGTFKGVSLSSTDNAGTTSSVQADLTGVSAMAAGGSGTASVAVQSEQVSVEHSDGTDAYGAVTVKHTEVLAECTDGADTSNVTVVPAAITLDSPSITLDSVAVFLPGLPVYADNAAAITGGLATNQLYRTASGAVMVVYTP